MFSYRHAFHAGNHADVLKHTVQALIIESLKKKEKPFIVLDTHAGGGLYDLRGDWRAGAAWFESQLVDYDVYSNQANWLYIAGRGTDPRGGRRFNPIKQAQDHDADGSYRRMWGTA